MPPTQPKPDPQRDRRRRSFLRALAAGDSVVAAAENAAIPWSTLYAWRRDAPKFRAAWDRAARLAQEALADRFQSALIERAIDGIDEPVFHAGKLVGMRKRYSDGLLLAGLRALQNGSPPEAAASTRQPRPRVIVETLGPPTEEELRALGKLAAPKPATTPETITAPAPPPAEPAPATAPSDPASAPPLRWDHLTHRDAEERW